MFDEAFQDELEAMYRQTGQGQAPQPPAMMCSALLVQAYTQAVGALGPPRLGSCLGVVLVCVPMNFRMMLRPCLGGLLITLISACSSFKRDMEDACHAVERSKARELPITEEEVLTRASSWAAEHARTSDGQAFWAAIENINPKDKPGMIRETAKEAGVVGCPLADALEATVLSDELKRQ